MSEIHISGFDRERGAFEIDVDPVETVLRDDARYRGNVVRNALRVGEGEVLAAATKGDHDLLALALQIRNVALELLGIETGRCVKLHGPFRRVLVRGGESDDDHVPLRRDLAERECRTRRAVA